MKNHKNEQNKYHYLTKLSHIRQDAMNNYSTMEEWGIKEKEMVERLRTTINQVNQIQNKIKEFERGKSKSKSINENSLPPT